jgi:serine/threonine protein kinase
MNEGQRVNRYNESFLASNLSNRIQKNCDINANNMPIYPLRMPYLGVSFNQIREEEIMQIRKIPFTVLVNQIHKLFKQVNRIREVGFIHGDIRESNIMINPSTGKITLIDFDWLMSTNEFYAGYQYSLGFYSNPPESLLYFPMNELINYIENPSTPKTVNAIKSVLVSQPNALYAFKSDGDVDLVTVEENPNILNFISHQLTPKYRYERYIKQCNQSGILAANMTVDHLKTFNYMNYNFLHNAAVNTEPNLTKNMFVQYYLNNMAHYFDSYGLAFSLLYFIRRVFSMIHHGDFQVFRESVLNGDKIYTDDELMQYFKFLSKLNANILYPMFIFTIENRIDINEGMRRLDELIAEVGVNLSEGGGSQTRRHLKSRRRKSPAGSARDRATSSKTRVKRR